MLQLNNKSETFQRLNYLKKVENIFKKIMNANADFVELSEMLKNEDLTEEFKKLLIEDINKLNEEEIELKIDLIQSLIPAETEDKENAIIELSAGVGGLVFLFCYSFCKRKTKLKFK
jgi:protein subunit release factor A